MTPGQPAEGEVASFYYSVRCDGLLCIGRTTGVEPAVVTHERAEARFVAGDHKNHQATH